jgi:hypothetical protein
MRRLPRSLLTPSVSITTRRILIGLTIIVLVVVSAGIGVLVANWPQVAAQASSAR